MARLPPLNALRCFESAARWHSFSKSAEELHVTQSAVSHQIRQLEQWFGTSLFDRLGRQTVPTPKGQELAKALAEAFDIMATACKRVSQSDAAPALTIAALPSIATIWLIPRLARFFTDHPEISVRVAYAFAGQPLNFEDYDIAILWGVDDWEDCVKTPLLDGSTIAVCNPQFLGREGNVKTPQDLMTKTLLHDTDRLGWQDWMRTAGLKHAGPAPGPTFQDFNLLRAAALAGQGVALCPTSLIRDDLASGRLVQMFNDIIIKRDHAYYMIEPSDAHHQHATAIAEFKSWLLQQAASEN